MRSGEAVPCVMTLAHAAMPWSMKGRQKAWGSSVWAWGVPIIFSHCWVPSSTCFFQRSKSCCPPVSAIVTPFPCPDASRARRQPRGDRGPAVHRGAAPGDERDVPAGHLHVLAVRASHGLDQRLDAAGGRDVVLPGPHREDGTGDPREIHLRAAHHQLPPDEAVLLVELPHPLPEELARERHVLVGPLVQRVEARHV